MTMNIIATVCVLACCWAEVNAAQDEVKNYIASRHIRAGEKINAALLQEAPVTPGVPGLTLADLDGREATRPIRAGETVTRLMVRPARAVRPGERIKVRAGSGGMKVYAMFTALQGGAVGETIDARNKASGRICQVVVAAAGEAYIQEDGK